MPHHLHVLVCVLRSERSIQTIRGGRRIGFFRLWHSHLGSGEEKNVVHASQGKKFPSATHICSSLFSAKGKLLIRPARKGGRGAGKKKTSPLSVSHKQQSDLLRRINIMRKQTGCDIKKLFSSMIDPPWGSVGW